LIAESRATSLHTNGPVESETSNKTLDVTVGDGVSSAGAMGPRPPKTSQNGALSESDCSR
jgi:hypothetical protein